MEVVSGLGDGVFWVALADVLFDRGAGATGLTLAVLARLGPRALLSAPAGRLADRLDLRRLLVTLDAARAVVLAGLAVAAATRAPVWVLLVLVLVAYTLAAPYRPAVTVALPRLVDEDRLAGANATIGTVRQLMTFVAPLVGTLVLVGSSAAVGFGVDALTFAASAALVGSLRFRAVPAPMPAAPAAPAERRRGPARSLAGPGVRAFGGLVTAMYVARGAELVLLVLVARAALDLGAAGVGLLTGAVGLGALAVLPVASRLADSDRLPVVILASMAATAVPLAGLGWIGSVPVACVVLAVLGAGVVVFEVAVVVALQRLTPPDRLGATFGVVASASNGGKLLGALAAPLAVEVLGLRGGLLAVGAVVGVCALGGLPSVRRLSLEAADRRRRLAPTVDALAALSLFEGASRLALERIAGSVATVDVAPGTVVIREGDPADDVYVARSGRYVVSAGGRVVNTMGAGDYFGEIGLLAGRTRTATVVVEEPGRLWRIPGPVFLASVQLGASASDALIGVMSERLGRTGHAVPDVAERMVLERP